MSKRALIRRKSSGVRVTKAKSVKKQTSGIVKFKVQSIVGFGPYRSADEVKAMKAGIVRNVPGATFGATVRGKSGYKFHAKISAVQSYRTGTTSAQIKKSLESQHPGTRVTATRVK